MNKQVSISDHELLALPWVELVRESRRPDVSLKVETTIGTISMDRHVHEINNLGYEVVEVSQVGHNGLSLYVSVQ